MEFKKSDLELIVDNTTTEEWLSVSKKNGYSIYTLRELLYGQGSFNQRNVVMIKELLVIAIDNLKRDLDKAEQLNNKLN